MAGWQDDVEVKEWLKNSTVHLYIPESSFFCYIWAIGPPFVDMYNSIFEDVSIGM